MKTLFTREFHTLAAGQLLSGTTRESRKLHVVHGKVWLTVEGELDDYWLGTDESLLLPAGRHIVLEAGGAACVIETASVTPCIKPPSLLQRLAANLKLPHRGANVPRPLTINAC